MKLKVRYENMIQEIELDLAAENQLWITLSLGPDEGLTQKQRELRLQEAWEEQFNKPEYNNFHKFDRHQGHAGTRTGNDECTEDIYMDEPLMNKVVDSRIYLEDEIKRERQEEYDTVCTWIRKTLIKKPKWASAFIAVRLDGVSVNDYAASIGVSDASIVSKWLARAERKLREKHQGTQHF